MLVVYVAVSVICSLLIVLIIYSLCVRRRQRLNWFEKSLVEEEARYSALRVKTLRRPKTNVTFADELNTYWSDDKPSDKCSLRADSSLSQPCLGVYKAKSDTELNTSNSSTSLGTRSSSSSNSKRNLCGASHRPKGILEVLKGLRKLTTRLKSSSERDQNCNEEPKTEWIVYSRKRMGSSPGSPCHEAGEEKFWVPPAVADRKRAQSLIPTTTQDSEDGTCNNAIVVYFYVYIICKTFLCNIFCFCFSCSNTYVCWNTIAFRT